MDKVSIAAGPLFHALECGIVSEIRSALDYGQLDPNTLFQDAVTTYRAAGSVAESRGRPLHVAARWGDTELIELLLERGADVNGTYRLGRTPLMEAVAAGRSEVARLLMQLGADVTAVDVDNGTALHIAAGCGLVGLIESLIESGADVNGTYKYGRTPLHDAAMADQADAARLLIFKGALVDAEDIEGSTPLLSCSTPNMASLLLDNGAEVNAAPRATGETLLHSAASSCNLELARLLLERGADIRAEDKASRTPLDVFRECSVQEPLGSACPGKMPPVASPRAGTIVPSLPLGSPGPSPSMSRMRDLAAPPGWTPRQEELCRLLLRAAAEDSHETTGRASSARSRRSGTKNRVRLNSLDNPRTAFVHRAGVDPRQQDMQEVFRWLHDHALGHYWEALHDIGVRTLDDMSLVTEADLAECGLRPIQRRRFFRSLQNAATSSGHSGARLGVRGVDVSGSASPSSSRSSGLELILLIFPIAIGVLGLFGRSLHVASQNANAGKL